MEGYLKYGGVLSCSTVEGASTVGGYLTVRWRAICSTVGGLSYRTVEGAEYGGGLSCSTLEGASTMEGYHVLELIIIIIISDDHIYD